MYYGIIKKHTRYINRDVEAKQEGKMRFLSKADAQQKEIPCFFGGEKCPSLELPEDNFDVVAFEITYGDSEVTHVEVCCQEANKEFIRCCDCPKLSQQ